MRRTLPPLNPLRSFEAAARHQNYTLAARELSVTQVAVSRQVRVLEEYLGTPLFERNSRSLALTDAGRVLLTALTPALDGIEHAVAALNKRGRHNVLFIQVYTAFAQRWLIPRLAEFREIYPHIDINLRTADQDLNFERQGTDAAIISALTPPPEHDCRMLVGRDLITVCAPSLLESMKPPLGSDVLRKFTLLHSLARPEAWREWLDGAGYTSVDARQGLRFETSSMVLGAAVAGLGVAVATRMLVEDELHSGVLVVPFEYVHPSPRKYYLVRPKSEPPKDALKHFSDWLEGAARA